MQWEWELEGGDLPAKQGRLRKAACPAALSPLPPTPSRASATPTTRDTPPSPVYNTLPPMSMPPSTPVAHVPSLPFRAARWRPVACLDVAHPTRARRTRAMDEMSPHCVLRGLLWLATCDECPAASLCLAVGPRQGRVGRMVCPSPVLAGDQPCTGPCLHSVDGSLVCCAVGVWCLDPLLAPPSKVGGGRRDWARVGAEKEERARASLV